MGASKVIHAFYNDDEILLDAVKAVKAEHHHIEEVFLSFSGSRIRQSDGIGTYETCNCFIHVWSDWSCCGYLDDQLYDDSGLATRHRW